MSKKPIPNGHSDFFVAATAFANAIGREPGRYGTSKDDCEALTAAIAEFQLALQGVKYRGQPNPVLKAARTKAQTLWRELRNSIKANPRVDALSKEILKLGTAHRASKVLTVPMEPPYLLFRRALHAGSSATPMHELSFTSADMSKARPEGAVRIELYFGLIGVEDEVPTHPGVHLRSFVKSPIVLAPAMPQKPMIALYWGRWADAQGNVGPFCQTVVGSIVGGMRRFHLAHFDTTQNPMPMIEDRAGSHDVTIRIALLEMQRSMMLPNVEVPDPKQLEGPSEEAEKEAA